MQSANELLDLRVRRTYKFLWDALMSLMAEQDFESITVTDICERAMVHRTTFYKHYEDKRGLLYHGIQDELNALFESVDEATDKSDTMDAKVNTRARLIAIFEHVLKRQGFYRLMLTGEGFDKFNILLQKSLRERFKQRFQHEGKPISLLMTLHIQLQAASIVSMIAWWLENDCPYPPHEMIKYVFQHIDLVR